MNPKDIEYFVAQRDDGLERDPDIIKNVSKIEETGAHLRIFVH